VIYLITGVPGSGKTLYAVSTHIQKLTGEQITDKLTGEITSRRLVCDGIKGLLLPHELMAPGIEDPDGNMLPGADGDGVWNWFDWCKPGDVIVIDEVQRWWRPRGMSTKPPKMIKALETHRHLGVDFVIITQNPMLIDQNVRRLVGRHQNVRRLLGMARAIVYDWDTCAADVTRTKGATSSIWNYPKNAYKLYKSAELHTKQRQKIPLWLAVPVIALIGGAIVAPSAFGTLSGAMTGRGVSSSAKAEPVADSKLVALPSLAVPVTLPASAPSVAAPSPSQLPTSAPVFAGCVKAKTDCKCFDTVGVSVSAPLNFCVDKFTDKPAVDLAAALPSVPDVSAGLGRYEQGQSDAAVLAFMRSNK